MFNACGVFIVACKRTPFGTNGGVLKNVGSVELGQIAARAAIESISGQPFSVKNIDSVIVGNVIQHSQSNGIFASRHIGLGIGVPIEVPCLNVNRLCGSGFQAVIDASHVYIIMR